MALSEIPIRLEYWLAVSTMMSIGEEYNLFIFFPHQRLLLMEFNRYTKLLEHYMMNLEGGSSCTVIITLMLFFVNPVWEFLTCLYTETQLGDF